MYIFSANLPYPGHSHVDAGYLIASNADIESLQQGMGANIGGPMR